MDGIAWAGSAMIAARTRLDIAAENLANVSSDGYRRTLARARLTASGVVVERERARESGGLRRTGRDFDLAIVGEGTFSVRDPGGRIRATRDGRFVRERGGSLQDPAGGTLLDERGRVLRVPDGPLSSRDLARIALPPGSRVHGGFLESAGVDAIAEMVNVLAAERSFESAQKVVTAIDATREKSSEAARVK